MKSLKFRLILAASATAILAACAQLGIGDQAGCRTIYVFKPAIGDDPGGIVPVSSCAGLPRETLQAQVAPMAAPMTTRALAEGEADEDGEAEEASPPRVVTPVSAAAAATRPHFPPATPYAGAQEMLENADMAAFMGRVRADYAANQNAGAWGYVIIDALAAGDIALAEEVLEEMTKHTAPDMLSAVHMRPWVQAFAGSTDSAQLEMARLRRVMPSQTVIGHRALLAEALGETDTALAIYAEGPTEFNPPRPEDAASPGYLMRVIAFNGQRLLAVRQAELLRALRRDEEAVDLLTRLLAAVPTDAYVAQQLERARRGDFRPTLRTLKQAMAQAISDEADLVLERQSIMAMMVGRGAKPPFNHLLASMRQSALLLDPDNGELRLIEASELHQQGKFEAALRMAQLGNPAGPQRAALASAAGLAALQLNSPETLLALTERSLSIDSRPEAKLSAAGALTQAGYTEMAIRLADEAIRAGLPEPQRVFATLTKAQAYYQAGDGPNAIRLAREARDISDTSNTKQFLASMLVRSPDRQEGLQIMRDMLLDAPGDTGLMNNLGYSLIDGHINDDELDEGFTLLKEASRLAPDEPNLLDSMGWAYYQYGDFREALRFIEMAIEAYKPFDHYELFDHLGDIHWRLGDQKAAREAWRSSLTARPPAHYASRIAAKLENGMTTAAPERRDTPEVPLNRSRGGINDI